MKTIEQLGELFLGTRLKRLSDAFYDEVDKVYKSQNIDLSSRVTALLFLLHEAGSASITEIADALGLTHPAVNQMSKKLLSQGYIESNPDSQDERKRILSLSEVGNDLVSKLQPIWQILHKHLHEIVSHGDHNFMLALANAEENHKDRSLSVRATKEIQQNQINAVEIFDFQPEFRDDFKRLNVEWLEKYFYVEEIDNQVLSNPEQYIIEPGGNIYFAKLGNEIVGTVALMIAEDGRVELTKMAVTENYQGLKIGKKLLQYAIEKFRASPYKEMFLESNSRLPTAIRLYEKYGFQHKTKSDESHYQRADVYMEFVE